MVDTHLLASLDIDDIAHLDLYSCFPRRCNSVLALSVSTRTAKAVHHQTGGLSFAGGPWNEYVMHSIARWSRPPQRPRIYRSVWANGGFVTKHAFGHLFDDIAISRFQTCRASRRDRCSSQGGLADAETASHDSTTHIEAYTVMHGRTSQPETAQDQTCRWPAHIWQE